MIIKKKLIFISLIILILPIVYAASYGSGNYGEGVYGAIDSDNDGVDDDEDNLLYNETNVETSGITQLNITIEGNSTKGKHNGNKNVSFYDQGVLMINFTYNFSQSNVLDLSKVVIQKTSTYIIVNFSGQLRNNKTLYIDDNSFVSLCVKDAEINSIDEISSGCNGANETDFTTCLGNSEVVSLNGINCTDQGSRIKVENLQYSAIKGTTSSPATSDPQGGSSGGSTRTTRSYECSQDSDCNTSQYCFNHTCCDAECFDNSACNTKEGETCWNHRCVKLFDMEILEFESPVNLGEFFDFTYFLKAVAEINGDVEINFWIEKKGEIVTSGKDVVYMGSFDEKTKTKKLFLPSDVKTGTYIFNIEVTYKTYSARSHRTIEVIVNSGLATIKLLPSTTRFVNGIISALIGIGAFILSLVFYLERRKIKKQIKKEERWIKNHKISALTFILIIVLGILIYSLKWYKSIGILIIKASLFFIHYSKIFICLIILIILIIIITRKRLFKKFKEITSIGKTEEFEVKPKIKPKVEIEDKLEQKQSQRNRFKNWAIEKIEAVRLKSEKKSKKEEFTHEIEDKTTESKIKNRKDNLKDSDELI